eukprot:1423290-Amphidinium_carterae.1
MSIVIAGLVIRGRYWDYHRLRRVAMMCSTGAQRLAPKLSRHCSVASDRLAIACSESQCLLWYFVRFGALFKSATTHQVKVPLTTVMALWSRTSNSSTEVPRKCLTRTPILERLRSSTLLPCKVEMHGLRTDAHCLPTKGTQGDPTETRRTSNFAKGRP